MIRAQVIILIGVALLPTGVRASWFEFCDIEGTVVSVAAESGRYVYSITVTVTAATRSSQGSLRSYTDCTEHIGNSLDAKLKIPRRKGIPSVGDQIAFFRSAVDGFGEDGSFAGTSVSATFRSLRRLGSHNEG